MSKPHVIAGIIVTALLMGLSEQRVCAQQHDAWYYDSLSKNKGAWSQEDKGINKKLADLEKRFGKK